MVKEAGFIEVPVTPFARFARIGTARGFFHVINSSIHGHQYGIDVALRAHQLCAALGDPHGNDVALHIRQLAVNDFGNVEHVCCPRFEVYREFVMPSFEHEPENQVLRLVCRIPQRHHRIVAVADAPIGKILRGTHLDASRNNSENV